ncbi:MAG: spoIIIAG [Symbiobacteriaceae bacterium]|nr:spoIIIAG [Symbiobacteriaceae bacterium]
MSDKEKQGPKSWQEFLAKPPDVMKLALVAAAVGVALMTAPGLFGLKGGSKGPPAGATPVAAEAKGGNRTEIERLQEQMSSELEEILSDIEGAGQVGVKVTLATGVINVPVINTSEQKTVTGEKAADNSGRTSETTTVTKNNVVLQDALAVSKQLRPEIAGVVVVADGARSAQMRYRLSKAVADHLRLPIHMVRVEARAREES